MENTTIKEIQSSLLKTYKAFLTFCEQHEIKFYAAYGTLLGAIRHHGFIPWDDDMDVFMLREDYNKLLSVRNLLIGTDYLLSDFSDGESPYPMAKFYDTNSTIWEYKQFPHIIGSWIDIFIVDEYNPESESDSKLYDEYHHVLWNYRKAMSVQSWGEIFSDFVHLNGFNGPIKLVKQLFYHPRRKSMLKKALQLTERVKNVKGTHFKPYTDIKRRVYDKKWFEHIQMVPFEDTVIPIPNGFDELLKDNYGDYMTPPPEEKRVAHLNHFFFMDLTRKLSHKEIMQELSKRPKTKEPSMSISVLIDEIRHRKGFH